MEEKFIKIQIYNLKESKWNLLQKELIKLRKNSICFVYNYYLYVFFGFYENNQYLNSFEKINLDHNNSEIFSTGKYHMIYGTILRYDRIFYIFGGKNENGALNASLKFIPSTNKMERGSITLKAPYYFHQSNLLKIGENSYCNFSIGEKNIVKFNLN